MGRLHGREEKYLPPHWRKNREPRNKFNRVQLLAHLMKGGDPAQTGAGSLSFPPTEKNVILVEKQIV